MKRILFYLLCCLSASSLLFAQTEDSPQTGEVYVQDSVYQMNQKGDHQIKIELALQIPFRPSIEQLKLGGGGSLGYMYFLTDWLLLGGDISFSYAPTIGSNQLTFIPILFKIAAQPTVWRFEFPISIGIGGVFQNYLDRFYFGLAVKPSVGAFFRINPSWSVGLHTGLYIMPQWYTHPQYNYTALIMDAGLSARYHF